MKHPIIRMFVLSLVLSLLALGSANSSLSIASTSTAMTTQDKSNGITQAPLAVVAMPEPIPPTPPVREIKCGRKPLPSIRWTTPAPAIEYTPPPGYGFCRLAELFTSFGWEVEPGVRFTATYLWQINSDRIKNPDRIWFNTPLRLRPDARPVSTTVRPAVRLPDADLLPPPGYRSLERLAELLTRLSWGIDRDSHVTPGYLHEINKDRVSGRKATSGVPLRLRPAPVPPRVDAGPREENPPRNEQSQRPTGGGGVLADGLPWASLAILVLLGLLTAAMIVMRRRRHQGQYQSYRGGGRPGRRPPSLWILIASLLVIGEYQATQSMFWIAPATEEVYGTGFADLAAYAGYGVTASLVLLSIVGKRWLTLRISMWLFLPMGIGYLFMFGLPAWPMALMILIVIGLMAVQIAYVRGSASNLVPRTGNQEHDDAEQEYVQTRMTGWIQGIQPIVIVGELYVAQLLGPRWGFLFVAASLFILCVLGLAYTRQVQRVERAGAVSSSPSHQSQSTQAPTSREPAERRTWNRRVVAAAWLNFLQAGAIGTILMLVTYVLKQEHFTNAGWAIVTTGMGSVAGIVVSIKPRQQSLLRQIVAVGLVIGAPLIVIVEPASLPYVVMGIVVTAAVLGLRVVQARLKPQGPASAPKPAERLKIGAVVGLLTGIPLAASTDASGWQFLAMYSLSLVVIFFASIHFEGGIGDLGLGIRRAGGLVPWTAPQFLVLNAGRALGFTVGGHIVLKLAASKVVIGHVTLSYLHAFLVFAGLTVVFSLIGLPKAPQSRHLGENQAAST
jgi:hypothetical protein